MRKKICVLLTFCLIFTAAVPAAAEQVPFGMLSMLNMTEEECVNYILLRTLTTGVLMMEDAADSMLMYEAEGEPAEMDEDAVDYYIPEEEEDEGEEESEEDGETPAVVFYDSLDAMLMASYEEVGSREPLYNYAQSDMPEGTIATDPYFSDVIVDVTLNATAEEIRDSLQ